MKLSDYIADFLSKEVDAVFVGNGGCVVHILDSLDKIDNVKLVPCENEQGAAIAAEAYSRVSKNIGVSIATSGPGMINFMQGIACAYYDSIPSLYISGAPPVSQLKMGRKARQIGFQEMDVVGIVSTITKYAVLVTEPKKIRYELEKLIYFAKSGRPGPVLLDLPDDIQRAEINPDELEEFIPEKESIFHYLSEIDKMLKMIQEAKRPIIIAGGGIKLSKTEDVARDIIKKSGIPVAATWSTIDMFTEDFPGLIGNFGISANRYGNFAVQNADLIISLGSRLDTHETGSNAATFSPNSKKIVVDIDEDELNKNNGMNIDLKIKADLRHLFADLSKVDIKINEKVSAWKNRIKEWREKYPICLPEYYEQDECVNPYVFMNELSKMTGEGDIVITDAGGTLTWTMQSYKIRKKQDLFSAFNHSPMGYAFPAAIGAYYADPSRNVICITGDGGFNMNIQELGTYYLNNLNIKIFIMNNKEYGIIKQTQDTWLDSKYVCSDIDSGVYSPDFIRIAKAYDIKTEVIENHSELNDKIKKVLNYNDGPILCNVTVKSGQKILPKLVFGKPIEDLYPLLDREEFNNNMKND